MSSSPLATYCTGPTPPTPGDILDGYLPRRWLRWVPTGNSYVIQTVTAAGIGPHGQARWRVTLIRLREQPRRWRPGHSWWRWLGGLLAALLLAVIAMVVVLPAGDAEAGVLAYSHCTRPARGVRVCAWPVVSYDTLGNLTVAGGGSIRYRNGYSGLSALGVFVSHGPQAVGPAFGAHPRRHTQPAVVIQAQRVVVTVVASGPWGTTTVRSWPEVVG
jgi:hypothetical protein